MKLGAIVVVVTALIGYVMALALYRLQNRTLRYVAYFLLFSPLLTSVVVRSYGWALILGDGGFVNNLLLRWHLVDQPVRMLYEFSGVTIGLVHILLPFMIFPILGVLDQLDPMLEQAAADLGATGWTTFRRVILPLTVQGVIAGVAARVRARDQRVRDAVAARRRPRAGARGEDLQRRRRPRLAARRRSRRTCCSRSRSLRSRSSRCSCGCRPARRGRTGSTRGEDPRRPARIALYAFLVAGLVFMVAPIAIVVVESFNSSAFGQWPPPGLLDAVVRAPVPRRRLRRADDPQPRGRARSRPPARSSPGRSPALAIARYRFPGRRAVPGLRRRAADRPEGRDRDRGVHPLPQARLVRQPRQPDPRPHRADAAVRRHARRRRPRARRPHDRGGGGRPRRAAAAGALARDAAADAGDPRRGRGVQLHHQLRRAGRVDLPRRPAREHAADGDVHLHAEVPGSDARGALVAADRRVAARPAPRSRC